MKISPQIFLPLFLLCAAVVPATASGAGLPAGILPEYHPPSDVPDTLLHHLEKSLINSRELEVRYQIELKDALTGTFSGTLKWGKGGSLALNAEGSMLDRQYSMSLRSRGEKIAVRVADSTTERPTPPEIRQAIAVGLTRMGIMHNLARLIQGKAPDHADGGVDQWVTVNSVAPVEEKKMVNGRPATGIAFNIVVSGMPAGSAVLWLDAESGLPVLREQKVEFPQGTMVVTERYEYFAVQ